MALFNWLKPSRPVASANSGFGERDSASQGARRDLLRMALRDTLNRNGIPTAWVGMEMLPAVGATRGSVHVRLLYKHWNPDLLVYSVALQNQLAERVRAFDERAGTWLRGFSWQFALSDESECPQPPASADWVTRHGSANAGVPASSQSQASQDRIASLEQLLLPGDQAHVGANDFQQTQPSGLTAFEPTRPVRM